MSEASQVDVLNPAFTLVGPILGGIAGVLLDRCLPRRRNSHSSDLEMGRLKAEADAKAEAEAMKLELAGLKGSLEALWALLAVPPDQRVQKENPVDTIGTVG
ncbi:hypothetical protein N7456_010615 [Penicillium angulare]|uniref:Uncharacterized protein n=1 Tax=Penicillium angulare TaxID=116970 RepID=A0A9W9K6D4_9EURO|nr:hypothetical protein N7456_010615 [Penicillium angulare]